MPSVVKFLVSNAVDPALSLSVVRGLPPQHPLPIDIHDWLRHSVVPPVILDRGPATEHGSIVIDDAKPARREPRIKPVQHLNRRLIQIAVEPKDGDSSRLPRPEPCL